ncbi:MAG TPA: energy transducer TonB [Sphingomicrobium sp.]|jgi:protein TonB|nr:energy transducer TonB [Sphingomicrobium sp.]
MYRSDLNTRDKGGAIVLVAAIHAALLFVLLHMSGKIDLADPQSALKMFDVNAPEPPPPPPPPQQQQREQQKPKEKEGGSPANVRSQATPVVAPKPEVEPQRPNPIAVTETPSQGAAPTQGAAAVRGPGTGAGGTGTGTGNGSGSGSGGGDGGVADPPHLISPVLTGRDIPRDLLQQWPGGTPVFLRLRVNPQGYVSECNVLRGTGVAAIDNTMCNIAHDRLRFRPAVNRSGQPVAGWFGYAQRPPR